MCGLLNDSTVRFKDFRPCIEIHKTLLPTTAVYKYKSLDEGGEERTPKKKTNHVSSGFTQNVESVRLRSKQGLAIETCHGGTKEINPVNQTRQTKLNWKHTWVTLESRLKDVCMQL